MFSGLQWDALDPIVKWLPLSTKQPLVSDLVKAFVIRARSPGWYPKQNASFNDVTKVIQDWGLNEDDTKQAITAMRSVGVIPSVEDRIQAHVAAILCAVYRYAPSTVRMKLSSGAILPQVGRTPGVSRFPLTALVIQGYQKFYFPANRMRLPMFPFFQEFFYKPFESSEVLLLPHTARL